jgi:hypothetical protein
MSLRIVCSGYLIRYPLGGFSYHHLQYLIGLSRLGHRVTYFEDFGWPNSCYDPRQDVMTSDPDYGIGYFAKLRHDFSLREMPWCYLAENGSAHGLSRGALTDAIRDCDLYLNLSNINWIEELELCRRRALIDTDPVFTQIDGHGMRHMLDRHHVHFTYGQNIHRAGCTMPTADLNWRPTRQPVVLDLWPVSAPAPNAPITTVMNWSAYGGRTFQGQTYGQKDAEFEPFLDLPRRHGLSLRIVLGAATDVEQRLSSSGWDIVNARQATRDPAAYRSFIHNSKAELAVAKHGYVLTQCGWFSDRSCGYLASGRPVVVQDTGFSRFLPCGKGLLTFRNYDQAIASLRKLDEDYDAHCRAARAIVAEHFDARVVLNDLLEQCF